MKRDKLPPICQGWREQAAKRRQLERGADVLSKASDNGKVGISFQLPEGWDDGSGKIRHLKSGPHAGRVYWTSRAEAREIAARWSDSAGRKVTYDP